MQTQNPEFLSDQPEPLILTPPKPKKMSNKKLLDPNAPKVRIVIASKYYSCDITVLEDNAPKVLEEIREHCKKHILMTDFIGVAPIPHLVVTTSKVA